MAEAEAWVIIPKLDKDKTGCVFDMRPLVLCKDCKYHDEEDGKTSVIAETDRMIGFVLAGKGGEVG